MKKIMLHKIVQIHTKYSNLNNNNYNTLAEECNVISASGYNSTSNICIKGA